jgi:hypothetical protein
MRPQWIPAAREPSFRIETNSQPHLTPSKPALIIGTVTIPPKTE